MDRKEFVQYIQENFNISGEASRLIDNVLYYVEKNVPKGDQYNALRFLLDGTIGLENEEIRKINM